MGGCAWRLVLPSRGAFAAAVMVFSVHSGAFGHPGFLSSAMAGYTALDVHRTPCRAGVAAGVTVDGEALATQTGCSSASPEAVVGTKSARAAQAAADMEAELKNTPRANVREMAAKNCLPAWMTFCRFVSRLSSSPILGKKQKQCHCYSLINLLWLVLCNSISGPSLLSEAH